MSRNVFVDDEPLSELLDLGAVEVLAQSRDADAHTIVFREAGRAYTASVIRRGASYRVVLDGVTFDVDFRAGRRAGAEGKQADGRVLAMPMDGRLIEMPKAVGDTVEPGEVVFRVEAMKLEANVVAVVAGRVAELSARTGDRLAAGAPVAIIEVNTVTAAR